ncbi:HAD-IA family hydrolase [Planctomonas psychrotolerans]|uniref:HAD-IA family hydrolase n=1 Tax=Planctomonas psychrotolerans TaxID=2528712 RepID=UPI0012395B0C|nr:HAD-IA family hydrolase [Planctomonas psychrotolerans]
MSDPIALTARAMLFDMDGTLVDSTAVVEEIWSRFATRFGLDTHAVLHSIHGIRAEDSVRRFAPAGTDVAALVSELTAFELDNAGSTVAIAGADAFLGALPPTAVALVTSASVPLMTGRMRGAAVGIPSVLVTAEDVTHGKPAPDGYLRAAELLGVEPRDAIVFEDAEAGIRAGLAAGMRVVVVGEHVSPTTEGLPRIRDFLDATIDVTDGVVTLTLPSAVVDG